MSRRIGIGIIGVRPEKSWAARAHIPALKALADDYEIVAFCNSRLESAQTAADFYGVRYAFASAADLSACPAVDLVAITVKVPHHMALVRAALNAGKHVYCEWPLGNGLAEAREMAAMADAAKVVAICGMQARFAPAFSHVRDLIRQGYVGELLSVSVIGSGFAWGGTVDDDRAYNVDIRNGATMLSIPVGHTMEGLCAMLDGEVSDIQAQLTHGRKTVINIDTGRQLPFTAHDQVLFSCRIGGVPLSVHYRGGQPRGTGLLIEINGAAGDIQISGPCGLSQQFDLDIRGATGDAVCLTPISIPFSAGMLETANPGNVTRLYKQLARHIRTGKSDCPTFADAVQRHQMLEAIEVSARTGRRTQPDDF